VSLGVVCHWLVERSRPRSAPIMVNALDGRNLRWNKHKPRASKAHDPHGGQRAPRDREHHDALLGKRPAGQSLGPFRVWMWR
jgi:hypothetical protein